jgi:nucleoside-diphosphate-sugar epimerase
MKVLFIGGTGNISTACTTEAVRQGIEVVHINRGTNTAPVGVRTIQGDIRDIDATRNALNGESFDCVVDWIAFDTDHIEGDISLFRDKTRQFIVISSASVYQKPPSDYRITESTPAYNPFWNYSQKKIACEQRLIHEHDENGFPFTIVRPSHTYSVGWIPTTFGSRDFTIPQRILDGRKIVVHGDGQSLWTLTHTEDFAVGFTGLIGHPRAIGETFHITSDEALSWDHIHRTIGHVLGTEPDIVHIPSEVIARQAPSIGPGLLGDKMYSVVFDNTKIKRFVPAYNARIPFHRGVERSVQWLMADESRRIIDEKAEGIIDSLVADFG